LGQGHARRTGAARGRFIVHGQHDRSTIPRNKLGIEIEIAAALAFGIGHHGTTPRARVMWAGMSTFGGLAPLGRPSTATEPQSSANRFRVARKPRLLVPTREVPNTSDPSSVNVPENPLVTSCPPDSGRANRSGSGVC
jgi:hypothetical protein